MPRLPSSDALRLSLLYAAWFALPGVQMPFWPVWLEHRGLPPLEIGIVLGSVYWARVITNPLIGSAVDLWGRRDRMLVGLGLTAAVVTASFLLVDGFWPILIVCLLSSALYAGIVPISETITMSLTMAGRLEYGRIRMWGSASFIVLAAVAGFALDHVPTREVIVWLVIACSVVTACATFLPPRIDPPTRTKGPRAPWSVLLKDRPFILVLLAVGCFQAGHTMYYGFGTLHWKAAGIPPVTIGALWAVGVIAEILLFAASPRLIARFGPRSLLLMAGLGGLLRWALMPLTTDPLWLFPLQTLHALTFGCAHVGAMHCISRMAQSGMTARAQALYSSVAAGGLPGLLMLVAGPLYNGLGAWAFLTSAVLSALGLILALRLPASLSGPASGPSPASRPS